MFPIHFLDPVLGLPLLQPNLRGLCASLLDISINQGTELHQSRMCGFSFLAGKAAVPPWGLGRSPVLDTMQCESHSLHPLLNLICFMLVRCSLFKLFDNMLNNHLDKTK